MDDLLTVEEVASKLKVSRWTIRAWCSQKYIPYFKLKGSVRFRASDIEKWLQRNLTRDKSLHRLKIEASAKASN